MHRIGHRGIIYENHDSVLLSLSFVLSPTLTNLFHDILLFICFVVLRDPHRSILLSVLCMSFITMFLFNVNYALYYDSQCRLCYDNRIE